MINYLEHKDINKDLWDSCINKSVNGSVYAYSWYLDVVSENWDALVYDNYKAVMPLTHKKKFGINYLCQPYFTQQLGVFSIEILSEEMVENFINNIPKHFKFTEINLNSYNKISTKNNKKITQNRNIQLDLISSYSNIYSNFSKNTRRNIKKAVAKNIFINEINNAWDIINLFKKNKGKQIEKFKEEQYFLLKRLLAELIQRHKVYIISAFTEKNQLCAGAFFVESNHKAIFLFSATNEEAKENGAMSLIIDYFIQKRSQDDITLDFEGSNDDNLARFYLSFGSVETNYSSLKINNLPWFIKWLK